MKRRRSAMLCRPAKPVAIGETQAVITEPIAYGGEGAAAVYGGDPPAATGSELSPVYCWLLVPGDVLQAGTKVLIKTINGRLEVVNASCTGRL